MKKLVILFSVILSAQLFAQVPDPAFNPMTAPGANGIHWSDHFLYWQNPESVNYNRVYFSDDSLLVAYNDSTVIVLDGFPSNIYASYQLSNWGNLDVNKKYYWKVVEYNSSGQSNSPMWHFTSLSNNAASYFYEFNNDFEGWEFFGPLGQSNWYWLNSSHTGNLAGELVFRWDPVFTGESYFISPELQFADGINGSINFSYFEDWWSNTVYVGCAITTDNGNSWTTIWDLYATGNVGPESVVIPMEFPGNFRLGFFYSGNSNDIDFFYVDNVMAIVPLTPTEPPSLLRSTASESIKKVTLNWNSAFFPITSGYTIEKKLGLPESNNPYDSLATTDQLTLFYEDFDVELNQVYTYRIRSVGSFNSYFSNEATAYVPAVVPVELLSFSSAVIENDVTLNWTTATETNNSGFEIQRFKDSKIEKLEEWERIGFVNGSGTTTETKSYSYRDENLTTGKYNYRLKQIDFDGTFEYSNIIEAEILPPAKFSLEQNYPNPFNPTTKISWQSPVNSHQTLKIYDVLGNEVAILVNEYRTAGKYEAEFNASNLSSGIYYYKITAGEFVQTRKMILLK